MKSLGNRMDAHSGVGPGFDAVRLGLALAVVFWHAFIITPHGATADEQRWLWLPHFGVLMMFFALSGFLISGSALRLSLPNFLVNRGLRIFPALAVEIILSAMILGAIFTILPLRTYFTSYGTYHYLTNIVALINYDLPGVFVNNPNKLVNSSLWTVPAEFLCYFVMSAFVLGGLLKKPAATIGIAIVISVTGAVLLNLGFSKTSPGLSGFIFNHFEIGATTRVTTAFVAGVVLYQLRYRIIYSARLALICAGSLVIIAALPPQALSVPIAGLITAAPFAYLTVFIGLANVPTPAIMRRGDYSYGIYLYGFPLQQAVYSLTPSIVSPWLQFLLVLPPLALFAAFSWHVVESPILAQRRRFSFAGRIHGARQTGATSSPQPGRYALPRQGRIA